MTRNKVMKLWTAIVTAFLALCTALGFTTPTAAAAVPQTEAPRNSSSARLMAPTMSPWSLARSLPPTMKQRIRAEAHGKSPSCRRHPLTDEAPAPATTLSDPATPAAEPLTPLQC